MLYNSLLVFMDHTCIHIIEGVHDQNSQVHCQNVAVDLLLVEKGHGS